MVRGAVDSGAHSRRGRAERAVAWSEIRTTCCIAGGGPAGMMLGFLLARAGVDVVVLEKHADFLRDFRGDTIHPSTLEVMHELGLLDEFLKLPHRRVRASRRHRRRHAGADRRLLPSADALQVHRADAAVGLPQFPRRARPALSALSSAHARRGHRPDRGGRPRRRRARDDARRASSRSRATLVVGADGRGSVVRERAGLKVDGPRRADRRALDAAVAAAERRRRARSAASPPARCW